MGRKDLPPGIGATDRFLGTAKIGGTLMHMVAGPKVPLVHMEFTSAAASAPDKHQPQPKLHLTVEQARELATLLLAAADLAGSEAGASPAAPH